jgi:hypothetical protein
MMNNFITVDRDHWAKLNSKIESLSYELLKYFIVNCNNKLNTFNQAA